MTFARRCETQKEGEVSSAFGDVVIEEKKQWWQKPWPVGQYPVPSKTNSVLSHSKTGLAGAYIEGAGNAPRSMLREKKKTGTKKRGRTHKALSSSGRNHYH